MRLLQLTLNELKFLEGDVFLIVESQEYGQPSDFRYNVAVSAQVCERLIKDNLVREVADRGRSIGFWQRLGGRGIYRPDLIELQGFPDNVVKIIKQCAGAKINFEGETWLEIIKSMPLPFSGLAIDLDESITVKNISIQDSANTEDLILSKDNKKKKAGKKK